MLVRFVIGFVFVTEGLQKFLFAATLGAGRFAKIGIPAPEVMGPFVGVVEVVGGSLLLAGAFTRFAAVALAIDMVVALLTTKLPILLGHGFLGFAAPSARPGFWSFSHEARTDLAMLFGCVFLIIVGAGVSSFDQRLAQRLAQRSGTPPRRA